MNEIIFTLDFFESGVYRGLTLQTYLPLLKEQNNASDDDIMLHSDNTEMTKEIMQEVFRQTDLIGPLYSLSMV